MFGGALFFLHGNGQGVGRRPTRHTGESAPHVRCRASGRTRGMAAADARRIERRDAVCAATPLTDGAPLPCVVVSAPLLERNTFDRDTYEVRWLHQAADPPTVFVAPNQLSRFKHPLPRALLKAWIMHAATMQTFGKFTVRALVRPRPRTIKIAPVGLAVSRSCSSTGVSQRSCTHA